MPQRVVPSLDGGPQGVHCLLGAVGAGGAHKDFYLPWRIYFIEHLAGLPAQPGRSPGHGKEQFQKGPPPRFFLLGKFLHPDPIFNSAQHGTEYDHENVAELVELVSGFAARIAQVGKIRAGIG